MSYKESQLNKDSKFRSLPPRITFIDFSLFLHKLIKDMFVDRIEKPSCCYERKFILLFSLVYQTDVTEEF